MKIPSREALSSRSARWWMGTLAVLATLVLVAIALLAAALHALAPQPGEWSTTLRIGPRGLQLSRPVSVPALLRMATHPLGQAWLDGRRIDTAYGAWTWQRLPQDRLRGTCSPCELTLEAVGPVPLRLPHAELQFHREMQDRYVGSLRLVGHGGEGVRTVTLPWKARLDPTGLAVEAMLADTALADAYAVFGSDAIPELARARIEGRVSASLRLRLPERRLDLRPRLSGFAVDGLGTEALLNAEPALACAAVASPAAQAAPGDAGTRVLGWLPRAVVAAEDQRYAEHAGYDLTQMLAAWSANQQPGAPRTQGASTLTQQLAKLVYTGDERSATRKLRELLYAVEMERTLGKGRILQLYLQIAPWGEGVCGAEAAARHYLRKPPAKLTPLEAAWLASLLRESSGAHGERHVDAERVGWVLGSLRGPLSAERRAEQLELLRGGWAPPAGRRVMTGQR
ncbi:biosynthetic peptidoglycan transglycosylase [uncultured Methylibium sp.]|uniref:biosynthetic peptidoglycan transglycosylase n=1 Tax=uncultured Methylibium sp. TaxID=381093 RepID=UPI0025EFC4D2|nr:biosynthetic peptidoglycan transglycosylase [uncultured Methylibium sp.]